MLPEKEYEKAFFTDAPRRELARLLLWHPKARDLLQWMSDPEEIEMRVKGTPQAALVDPGAPAQRAGVLSSLNMIADSLELLPDDHTKPGFRTRTGSFSARGGCSLLPPPRTERSSCHCTPFGWTCSFCA